MLGFLLLTFTMSVQGQLSVTWNGNIVQSDTVTDPVLIYIEDITQVDQSVTTIVSDHSTRGTLICRDETRALVSWDLVPGSTVNDGMTSNTFRQIRTGSTVTPSLSQLVLNREFIQQTNPPFNGIWHCRLNRQGPTLFEGQINVGIYSIAAGLGRINSNLQISLRSSSFGSNPPTFTLVGDTSGGPPTTYTWSRNGQVITNNDSYSISIAVRGTSLTDYQSTRYRSTLTVTGTLPGVYQYSVTNRATSDTWISRFTIEAAPQPPTNLKAAMINGQNAVQVSWTGPLAGRYRVTADPGGVSVDFAISPQTITLQPPGVYNIMVGTISQHYPGGTAGPVQVTVRGAQAPNVTTSSVTATSVTVSWTQPLFSYDPVNYNVTLRRVTGSGQVLCNTVEDNRFPPLLTGTVIQFTSLWEFSVYRVRVTPSFSETSLAVPSSREFTTLSARPTGAPRDVTPTTTSTSIMVTWTAIECIERNGEIIGYEVVFQRVDGTATTDGQVVGQTSTASGLQPFTNYTFQVRGVNSAGMGPFTTAITIRTDEDVPGVVSNFVVFDDVISVRFYWSAPVEPNGIIIAYELTYTVNGTNTATVNTSFTTITIELDINTNVTGILIRAYTSVGPGNASMADNIFIFIPSVPQPVVWNFQVIQAPDSETSVIVSWDRSSGNVTHYTVYYSPVSGRKRQANEMSVTVPGTENSTRINDLTRGATYQFQVTATIVFRGVTIEGERTEQEVTIIMLETITAQQPPTTTPERECTECEGGSITITVTSLVVTFLLTVIVITSLLVLGYYVLRARRASPFKKNVDASSDMAMKENAAYGPVTSSQQHLDHIYDQPDCKTESEYDIVK